MSESSPVLELCIDSVHGARIARDIRAHRVEVCANLAEGGTTPSTGTIRVVREHFPGEVVVMIRPRPGDFLYDEYEMEVMRADVRAAKDLGVHGVAIGALTGQGTLNVSMLAALIALARPMKVTVHRAIDFCKDPPREVETLIKLGVDRVLSSGGAETALEGHARLKAMVDHAGSGLAVVAAGGVRADHVRALIERTGVREVHSSARGFAESRMEHHPEDAQSLSMPGLATNFQWRDTDPSSARALAAALNLVR